MSTQRAYWRDCIETAAEECGLKLTPEQLDSLVSSAEAGHEHYGLAFYSPPARERLDEIEASWRARLKTLQTDFDSYRQNAERAVKQAFNLSNDESIDIKAHGEVVLYGGRTSRIQ